MNTYIQRTNIPRFENGRWIIKTIIFDRNSGKTISCTEVDSTEEIKSLAKSLAEKFKILADEFDFNNP